MALKNRKEDRTLIITDEARELLKDTFDKQSAKNIRLFFNGYG